MQCTLAIFLASDKRLGSRLDAKMYETLPPWDHYPDTVQDICPVKGTKIVAWDIRELSYMPGKTRESFTMSRSI